MEEKTKEVTTTNLGTSQMTPGTQETDEDGPGPSEAFVIFPLPSTSEDVQNENNLRLARIVDTSIWELPVVSRPETIHNLTAETASSESVNLTRCCVNANPSLHNLTHYQLQQQEEGSAVDAPLTTDTGTETEIRTDQETSTAELMGKPMSEPHCIHVIAEWPSQNRDFELLTKLDDEYSDPFCPSHQISDVFDPPEWFRQDLGDDDIPPSRRLRVHPGEFCLTTTENWPPSCKSNRTSPAITEDLDQ